MTRHEITPAFKEGQSVKVIAPYSRFYQQSSLISEIKFVFNLWLYGLFFPGHRIHWFDSTEIEDAIDGTA